MKKPLTDNVANGCGLEPGGYKSIEHYRSDGVCASRKGMPDKRAAAGFDVGRGPAAARALAGRSLLPRGVWFAAQREAISA